MGNARKGKLSPYRANFSRKWGDRREIPFREFKTEEGTVRYFGSGWAIFDLWDGLITLRCAFAYTGRKFGWLPSATTRKEALVALKKVASDVAERTGGSPTQADKGSYPCILEHLTETRYPDGSERQTSSLIVVADAQNWRVCLSDRDNARVMWKTGQTLQEALDSIELGLMGDDPSDWRKAATPAAKRKK